MGGEEEEVFCPVGVKCVRAETETVRAEAETVRAEADKVGAEAMGAKRGGT
jgi:hypothetical protein